MAVCLTLSVVKRRCFGE